MEEKNNDQPKQPEKPKRKTGDDGNNPSPMRRPTDHLRDKNPNRSNKK